MSVKLPKDFFVGLGRLICSMTLGGGELSPIEMELILETAEEIFQDKGSPKSVRGSAVQESLPWRSMFSFPSDQPSDPDPHAVFLRWMQDCDANGYSISPELGKDIVLLLREIAEVYDLSSPGQEALLEKISAQIVR